MVTTVRSLGLTGISGYEVTVECMLSGGLPAFDVVGLPDTAVKEARERVRAAVKNCGAQFPVSRITVNLAPARVRKEGTLYDLPILLGILALFSGNLFADISSFGLSSVEFCNRLLDEQKVVCIPGSAFGECGEGFIRIAYTCSDDNLYEALNRISCFCKKLMK